MNKKEHKKFLKECQEVQKKKIVKITIYRTDTDISSIGTFKL